MEEILAACKEDKVDISTLDADWNDKVTDIDENPVSRFLDTGFF